MYRTPPPPTTTTTTTTITQCSPCVPRRASEKGGQLRQRTTQYAEHPPPTFALRAEKHCRELGGGGGHTGKQQHNEKSCLERGQLRQTTDNNTMCRTSPSVRFACREELSRERAVAKGGQLRQTTDNNTICATSPSVRLACPAAL